MDTQEYKREVRMSTPNSEKSVMDLCVELIAKCDQIVADYRPFSLRDVIPDSRAIDEPADEDCVDEATGYCEGCFTAVYDHTPYCVDCYDAYHCADCGEELKDNERDVCTACNKKRENNVGR